MVFQKKEYVSEAIQSVEGYVFGPPCVQAWKLQFDVQGTMYRTISNHQFKLGNAGCKNKHRSPCANFNGHAVRLRGLEAGPALDPQTATATTPLSSFKHISVKTVLHVF